MSTPLNGSVLKGFDILDLITRERPEISANIVASELGINAGTAHRFLLTLEKAGVLASYKRGYFGLTQKLEELGRLALETNPLVGVIQPLIDDVSQKINESVMACRLGRKGPVCITVVNSVRPVSVSVRVGTVLEMHASAQGKIWLSSMSERDLSLWLDEYSVTRQSDETFVKPDALLNEINQIRTQGYALNRGDSEPDIGAVSVPVYNPSGDLIATLSAFGMLSRFNASLTDKSLQLLNEAAKTVTGRMQRKV